MRARGAQGARTFHLIPESTYTHLRTHATQTLLAGQSTNKRGCWLLGGVYKVAIYLDIRTQMSRFLLACSSPTRTTPLAGGATCITSVAITNVLTDRRVPRVPKVAAAARVGGAPHHPSHAQQ